MVSRKWPMLPLKFPALIDAGSWARSALLPNHRPTGNNEAINGSIAVLSKGKLSSRWPSVLNSEPMVNLGSMAPKLETQFIRACSAGKAVVLHELLQGGLSPETRDTYGLTGLIWAARKGHVGIAEVLLASGADPDAKDRRGRTALHHAVALKQPDFVRFLTSQGAFVNPVDMHGCTPLDLATMSGDKMAALLEEFGAHRKKSEKPPEQKKGFNRFGSTGAVGGPDLPVEVQRVRVQLNTLLRRWTGQYSPAIEGFSDDRATSAKQARSECGPVAGRLVDRQKGISRNDCSTLCRRKAARNHVGLGGRSTTHRGRSETHAVNVVWVQLELPSNRNLLFKITQS